MVQSAEYGKCTRKFFSYIIIVNAKMGITHAEYKIHILNYWRRTGRILLIVCKHN